MKLILTKELGRLAKWLRILGLDTVYFKDDNLSSLIIQALRDGRMIITRNHRLMKRPGMTIVLVKAENIREQIPEVLDALKIKPDKITIFSRCILCNEPLIGLSKEKAKAKVPEYVFKTQDKFVSCPRCNRIYWQGTHWGNVEEILKRAN